MALERSRQGKYMNEVTRILSAIEQGDPHAAEQLLPLVYDELRKLAAQKMAQEQPGQTLEPTALVHEAYLRLVTPSKSPRRQEAERPGGHWNSRGHFFAAVAEAMRRILVEHARARRSVKRGGGRAHQQLEQSNLAAPEDSEDLLALDEALDKLAQADKQSAELIKLRFFAGLTMDQAAEILGISTRTAHYVWAYARSWLRREIRGD
jgi:RNA polymerase sigma factor (TIGR02999 family)